ncbi:hypothetical protein LTS18_008037 [Coniosporium uncinatum]|uniref:Uncharacterized protein n=1 Tax=Coniosporium uncinatum TaxID=93489 RepID=A0ACC3DNT1_9PEZI|nr:hypothetical protein LTS18_008037 [Coniosporium uncinatum]
MACAGPSAKRRLHHRQPRHLSLPSPLSTSHRLTIRTMPLIRPSTIATRHLTLAPFAARRTLTSTAARSASDSHASESHYDPPGGWLWGIPPNEKPKREDWETVWYWGFFGSLILGGIAYAYKPDTRYVRHAILWFVSTEAMILANKPNQRRWSYMGVVLEGWVGMTWGWLARSRP